MRLWAKMHKLSTEVLGAAKTGLSSASKLLLADFIIFAKVVNLIWLKWVFQ